MLGIISPETHPTDQGDQYVWHLYEYFLLEGYHMCSTWNQLCSYTFVLAHFTAVLLHCQQLSLSENAGLCYICERGPHNLCPSTCCSSGDWTTVGCT